MKIGNIVKEVNRYLSNSTSYKLKYSDLKPYIDDAVDYINEELLTDYMTPDEAFQSEKLYYYLSSLDKIIVIPTFKNKLKFNCDNLTLYEKGVEVDTDDILFDAIYLNDVNRAFILNTNKEWQEIYEEDVPEDNILEYNYNLFPERYIRGCIVFGTVANRLEEEDELEEQYSTYKAKVNKALDNWKKQYYSCYDCRW